MVQYSVGDLAKRVGGTLVGDPSLPITGPADLASARAGEISFFFHPKYLKYLATTRASAVLVAPTTECSRMDLCLIRVESPSRAFSKIVEAFAPAPVELPAGVSERAFVHPSAMLGRDVRVGPFAVVSEGVRVGERTRVHAGVFLGPGSKVGSDCILYPNGCILERVVLGDRVVVHAGAVLGSDGFGFEFEGGRWVKVPQCGTVEVGDDVEIGANCAIDRARFEATRLGRGTKVDNLVHVGHNVTVGEHSLLIAQTGISGSARVGNRVILAGQTGVGGHLTIGDGVRAAGKTGITDDVPAGAEIGGSPAMPFADWVKQPHRLRKVDGLRDQVRTLSKKVEELESRLRDKR